MDEKQFNELVAKFGKTMAEQISGKVDEMRSGLITVDQLKTEVESLAKASDLTDVNKKIDELGVDLKKMQQKKDERPKTIAEQVASQHEALKAAISNPAVKGFNMNLDLKTNVTVGSIGSDNVGFSIPGWNPPAHKALVMENLFRRVVVPANHHGTIYYTDQTTTTRNAAAAAEAAVAAESAIAWTRRSLTLEKILDSIPLTYESMMDIAELTGEVQRFLDLNIALATQTQLYSGNGTPPNWYGIYSYATDFTQAIAAGLTDVDDANLADLIAVVADYIANGKESKYMPDFVLMNPRDLLYQRLNKASDGNYIRVPFMNDGMNQILQMKIVESSEVTANTMVVGCSQHATYYDVDGITLEFGLDGNDFTYDLITLKGRKRGNLLVRTADTTAFYKVTNITQRISDITA